MQVRRSFAWRENVWNFVGANSDQGLFTVTVGVKAASHAGYSVDSSRDVLRLLETLRDGQ